MPSTTQWPPIGIIDSVVGGNIVRYPQPTTISVDTWVWNNYWPSTYSKMVVFEGGKYIVERASFWSGGIFIPNSIDAEMVAKLLNAWMKVLLTE